jgi:hypothetical protein
MEFQEIVDRFKEKVSEIDLRHGPVLKMAVKGIKLSNETLRELKLEMDRTGFGTEAGEILFFKHQKVVPLGELVFFNEVRYCELYAPKYGMEQKARFLEKQIGKVNRFFERHRNFISYMEQGMEHLDHEFFTRNDGDISYYVLPGAYYLDPAFFSSHDMLWARAKGMGRYAEFLKERLAYLRPAEGVRAKDSPRLVWTGSKTAMTELIYGLYSSAVLNNGKDDLRTIASAFEEFFNIRLDNIYKTYSEIKIRKGGHAKFLEEMTYRYLQKIKDDDGL